jgi:flagellar hook-length control protein FliK
VFSVTSESAANLSLQSAPSKSARADQSPAPDSFSALIDSSAADTAGKDRPPDRPSRQQRPDDASAASDNRQPRDTASSSSANTQQAQPGAGQTVADAAADPGTAAKPAKPGVAKSGIVKTTLEDAVSDIMASPDAAAPSDPAAPPQGAASPAVTPAPVAVAIAAPVAAPGVVVAPHFNGSATEPLAIAAAAIATSTSTVEASKPAVTTAQAPIDLATNAPASATAAAVSPIAASAPATASTNAPDPVAAASNVAQAAASDTVASVSQPVAKADTIVAPVSQPAAKADTIVAPVNQPVAKADAIAQADLGLTTAAAAAAPVAAIAPKAAKTITPRGSESAAPVKTDIASDAADPSATPPSTDAADQGIAPQGPSADAKQKGGIAIDAGRTDPVSANAPTAAATASPHEHRAAAAQVQVEPADPVQVVNAVQQPHAQSAATVPAAAQLSVTAATSAMVPLNGLALQIAVTAQSGNSRFEIRLDPAELGRIDVRIDVDRHGQLTSHLTVEKPETLAMLRQDAPQLQRALDNAGFKTGDGGLQFSLRDQSSSGQNSGNEAGRNAQRLIISEDDGVPAAVAGRSYGRMPGSGSGVDIRV